MIILFIIIRVNFYKMKMDIGYIGYDIYLYLMDRDFH
jgi:hypothetical protein